MKFIKRFITAEVYVVFGLALVCSSLVVFMIKMDFFPTNLFCIAVAVVGFFVFIKNIRRLA